MRLFRVSVILVSLIGLAGCGNSDAPATDKGENQPPAQIQQEPISEEDFESGEVEGTIETVDEGEETETQEAGETP